MSTSKNIPRVVSEIFLAPAYYYRLPYTLNLAYFILFSVVYIPKCCF